MKTLKKIIQLIAVLSLMTSLYSCKGQETAFQKTDLPQESIVNRNNTGDIPDDIVDPIVDIIKLNCIEAANQQQIQNFYSQVNFPAAINCEFNESGNLPTDLNAYGNGPRKDGKVRARIEQAFSVPLPENAKICDVDFEFPTQAMEYDDEIFILLNNFVLMSSTNYATNSGSNHYLNGLAVNSKGLQTYKWSGDNSLYNLHYGQGVTPRYCYGLNSSDQDYQAKCNLPFTQTLGQIKLDIPQEKIIELGVISDIMNQNNSSQKVLDFGFVSTGDNDNGDCEHSAFGFNISVKYYVPEAN